MALIKCPDCGRPVSDLAFACPQCARPIVSAEHLRGSGIGRAESEDPASPMTAASPPSGPPTTDGGGLPPTLDGWLRDIRKARELPVGAKACDRCSANVSSDTFRRKIGQRYLCSDCADEDEVRNHARRVLVSKVFAVVGAIVVAGAVATGAVYLAAAIEDGIVH